MDKEIANDQNKNTNTKRSKSNLQYNEYKSNDKQRRTSESNLEYNQTPNQYRVTNRLSHIETITADNNNCRKANVFDKKPDNKRNRSFIETKVKNNFTIRGYRRKQENRKKQNNLTGFEVPFSSNQNSNRIEGKKGKYISKSSLLNIDCGDQYLEAGTYEGKDLMMIRESTEKVFTDDDSISDYSDFCQREQYNVECFNYYLNFGDPYVMNNGEISASDNSWYSDRQPNFGRVFYYRSQLNDYLCYDNALKYNFPNHQEFKYRTIEPYPNTFFNPHGMYFNTGNGYINGYIEPSLMPNDFFPYQIPHHEEFIPEKYFKTTMYEEPNDILNSNQYTQENDTLNVINLNSSLFVYNSNVHINTIHNEIYDINMLANNEINKLTDTTENNENDPVSPSATVSDKDEYNELENCSH